MSVVYLAPPITPSKALQRVSDALAKSVPSYLVLSPEQADLVVVPVVGRLEHVTRQVDALIASGKRYAIIQYAIRSTKNPSTSDWVRLWRRASVVWSYYDLPTLCKQDGTKPGFPFYHAPLGVDDVFHRSEGHRIGGICGSFARHWLSESHREIVLAAAAIYDQAVVWHAGEPVRRHPNCIEIGQITDEQLRGYYQSSGFVPGLRRAEGFELPAAEGLLCGAQPILFDTPAYRDWYDGLGCEFIPEGTRQDVLHALTHLFRRGPKPPNTGHRLDAAKRFNWPTICHGFWDRALA